MSEEKVERLSEGMDFIEEECGLSEGLIFEEANETIISESEKHKSPFKVIGVVKGVIQPIGELSRNKRLYPQTFWPEVLNMPEIQERLASRDMLGCISHADKRVDCSDLKSGEVSHIVTKLEVRESEEGTPFLYGEMEILDTPAGRIIKALYEGGANIYVSTRGAGKLVDVPGKPYREVLSSQYWLETVDFVRRPGFIKAHPTFEAVEVEPSQPQLHESQHESQIDEKNENLLTTVYGKTNAKRLADGKKMLPDEQNKDFKEDKKEEANEDLTTLKSQVQQLAQLVEKVVDSIYEQPNVNERAEALGQCISLLGESDLSEEAFNQVIDIIKKGIN